VKILLYSMNFTPELAGIGKYSGEMADWLAARGHEVRVIAAPPSFPHWAVFEGHSAWAYRKSERNGVTVWRAPTWVPSRPRALARMAHLFSFMLSSMPLLLAQARWRPDLVFVVEPPLFCAPAVLLFSKMLGIKSWLHIQDYEVDAAFGLGLGARRGGAALCAVGRAVAAGRVQPRLDHLGRDGREGQAQGHRRSPARAVSELGGRCGDPAVRGGGRGHARCPARARRGRRLQGRARHSGRCRGGALCGEHRHQARHRAAGRSGAPAGLRAEHPLRHLRQRPEPRAR
jgi:hypothetical protein